MKRIRTWIGVLPALLIGSLLVIAAVAPRAVGRAPGLPGEMAATSCNFLLQQSGGTDAFVAPNHTGVTQPIGFAGNAAACSLTVDPIYGWGRLDLVQWDPVALAPDPTTIALRTMSFDPTALTQTKSRADFYPPVVTRSLAEVAEPPRPTIAIDWTVVSSTPYVGQAMRYESNGSPQIPVALQVPAAGPRVPLPGAHPVLSHAVCGRDDALQSLQVVQSVMTTTSLSDTECFDLIQRFRVPVRSRLRWVELAFGVNPHAVYYDPVIAILDATGESEPPVSLPPSLVEAPYSFYVTRPFWGSHYDFDKLITLEPGHDYWLLARVEHRYFLYSRALTGGESPDFTANIGPCFKRTSLDGAWSALPGQALCFRLIGEPLAGGRQLPRGRLRDRPLGETVPDERHPQPSAATAAGVTPEPGLLRLRVAPNPAQGAALVSWSGAAGALRVDVLDAQGRRVAGNSGTAAEGRWLWSGTRDDGRPLPAGVYFVRGTDGSGRVASDRLVLIR